MWRIHTLPGGAVVLVGAPIPGRGTDRGEPLRAMVRLDPGGTCLIEALPEWSFPGAGKGERLPPGVEFAWPPRAVIVPPPPPRRLRGCSG